MEYECLLPCPKSGHLTRALEQFDPAHIPSKFIFASPKYHLGGKVKVN